MKKKNNDKEEEEEEKEEDESANEENEENNDETLPEDEKEVDQQEVAQDDVNKDQIEEKDKKKKKKVVVKGMSKAELKLFEKENDRRGVVYLSRIPPFVKPLKLRQLLSPYGEVCRIYLTPDDKKRKPGKKARKFVDGWVEFADKKIAKRVARTLNNRQIGGKRRSRIYDELWNIKYLKGFKWSNLTEQMVYHRQVREQRIRREMSQANKESNLYLKRVKQSKAHSAIEERKNLKRKKAQETDEGNENAPYVWKRERIFHQRKTVEQRRLGPIYLIFSISITTPMNNCQTGLLDYL